MRFRTRFRLVSTFVALSTFVGSARQMAAQDPITQYSQGFEARFDRTQPDVRYTLHADPSHDPLGYQVEMRIGNVRDTVRLAIPVWAPGAYRVGAYHRYIDHLTATTDQGSAVSTVRDDSSTWRLAVPAGHDIVVRYDVHYPTAQAAAGLSNYSFFRADGALFSGPMTYLYIVGHKLIPAHVTFDLPVGWNVVTGLVPTASPRMFFAPTYDVLIDCPTLVGAALHVWPFDLDGVHHRVAYYSTTPTVVFDTARFLQMHERVVATARDIMGRLPYREYTFIYEDGPGGGLEHLNSTTITAPGERVKGREDQWAGITAHEYFHAWNVKRVRPVELGPFAYDRPVRTTDLWWAEGMTDYFSTEIRRRSGLTSDTDAVKELAGRIGAYFNTPGYDRISPQRSSWTAWDPNTVNGGYNVSYYLTGSLIGDLLELTIRHATNGARGMDDVERLLFDRYAGNTGYTTENLLNAVNQVCGCDLQPFFDHYIAGHEPLPFDAVLAFAGWSVTSVRKTTDDHGQPLPDIRANVGAQTGVGSPGGYAGSPARLSLNVPDGSFGRAGLVDGDFITSVNGKAIATPIDFKAAFANAKVGDRYTVAYVRAGRPATTSVTILPETRVVVTLSDLPTMTEAQRAIRDAWLNGPAAHANVYHASATH